LQITEDFPEDRENFPDPAFLSKAPAPEIGLHSRSIWQLLSQSCPTQVALSFATVHKEKRKNRFLFRNRLPFPSFPANADR
jgi:hypothetical protein